MRVALAAGRLREQDRAWVRVTAHAFGLAGGGRVWWVPEVKCRPPAGTTAWGEAAVGLVGCGSRRFGFVASLRTGLRRVVGWRCCLWSPSVLCPTPRMRLTEADRSGGIKPDHTLLWSSRVRPDTTGPVCLGKPRIRGVGPRTQHPYGEKDPPNDELTSRSIPRPP